MKLLLILIQLVVLLGTVYCQPAYNLGIKDFTGGLFDKYSPNVIPDNCTPDCINVLFDKDRGVYKRNGYLAYNSVPIGDKYKVRSLFTYYRNDGGAYLIAVSSQNTYYSVGDGNFNLIPGATTNMNFDPMFVTAQNNLYSSNGVDNVWHWDTSSIVYDTDVPKGKYISYHRSRLWVAGAGVNPSYVYYSDLLFPSIFHNAENSPNVIYINSNDGDVITGIRSYQDSLYVFKQYSTWVIQGNAPENFVVRCVDPKVGCLYNSSIAQYKGYLQWLSHRGVERFDGVTIQKISVPIDTTMKNLRQVTPNKRFFTDTTSSDFSKGAGVNIDTMSVPGSVILTSYTYRTNEFYDTLGSNLLEQTASQPCWETFYATYTIILSSVQIYVRHNADNNPYYLSICNSQMVGISTVSVVSLPSGGGLVWDVANFSQLGITLTANATYFILMTSTSGARYPQGYSGLTSAYSHGISSGIEAGNIRTLGTFNFKIYGYIFNTRGQFQTQVHNIGTSINTWGLFDAGFVTPSGTNIYWGMASSPTIAVGSNNVTAITPNLNIPISTGQYVLVFSTLVITNDNPIESPRIDYITVNWYDGKQFNPPCAMEYDYRYWLAIATASETNDTVLIYDDNNAWTRYNNMNVYSVTKYRQLLYTGDANDTGLVYLQDTGNTDNGNNIPAYYVTKDINYGGEDKDKLPRFWYAHVKSQLNGSLTIGHAENMSSVYVSTTVAMTDNNIVVKKYLFPANSRDKYIRFKFSDSSSNPWTLFKLNLYFDEEMIK